MKKPLLAMMALFAIQNVTAAPATKDTVRFFDHFQTDAARSTAIYVEGWGLHAKYDDYDLKITGFGARGGIPLASNVEVGLDGGWLSYDPDYGDGSSGLTDIGITGKYHLEKRGVDRITLGIRLTLPFGDEDIGEGNTDVGFFGAIRHPLSSRTVILGVAGLNFDEQADGDRDTSLHLGAGSLYQLDGRLHLIGEFSVETEDDIMAITGGADYLLQNGSRLRGAISLGLDDGSPDFLMRAGYLARF